MFSNTKMSKITLMILKSHFASVINCITEDSSLHISPLSSEEISSSTNIFDAYNKSTYEDLMNKCNQLSRKCGIELSFDEKLHSSSIMEKNTDSEKKFLNLYDGFHNTLHDYDCSKEKISALEDEITELKIFAELGLDKIPAETSFVFVKTGWLKHEQNEFVKNSFSDSNTFIIPLFTNTEKAQDFVAVIGLKDSDSLISMILRSAFFQDIPMPSPEMGIQKHFLTLTHEREEEEKKFSKLTMQLEEFGRKHRKLLEEMYYYLTQQLYLADLVDYIRQTNDFVIFEGFVPEPSLDQFISRIRKATSNAFLMDMDNSLSNAPTLTPTNIFTCFDFLVHSYGIPEYSEINPASFFGITFLLMFGMMFGDIGHGAVILILGFFLRKYRTIATALILSGVSSVTFGFLFGSLFGREDFPFLKPMLFSPLHHINSLFAISISFGLFCLLCANGFNIANKCRSGHSIDVIFDRNGVAGFFFLAGVAGMIGSNISGWKEFSAGFIIAYALFFLLIIFFHQPLANICKKRPALYGIHLSDYIIEASAEVVESLLSNLSNTLSFIRVGAFAINHAALSLAVYQVAALLQEYSFHWPAIIAGNLFIIFFEGAIVVIQIMRLQYYEIFSRFFGGSGYAYVPMKYHYENAINQRRKI